MGEGFIHGYLSIDRDHPVIYKITKLYTKTYRRLPHKLKLNYNYIKYKVAQCRVPIIIYYNNSIERTKSVAQYNNYNIILYNTKWLPISVAQSLN